MDTNIKRHIAEVFVATALAVGAVSGINYVTRQPQVITQTGKPNVGAWGELTQKEVEALTVLLANMPKSKVGIFCATKDCEDLALDFDNAFESAKWESGIERPLMDTNAGIHVGPPNDKGKALADAIKKATNGRIAPEMLAAQIIGEDRLVLVISRKAR